MSKRTPNAAPIGHGETWVSGEFSAYIFSILVRIIDTIRISRIMNQVATDVSAFFELSCQALNEIS